MNHTTPRQYGTSRWTQQLPLVLSEAPDLATAAMMLARTGIPIFPCAPGGKHPLTKRGFHDASADPAQVKAWWGGQPDANIGMPTGLPSGVDVVDVDVHSAGNGFSAFERARSAGLTKDWTWLVRTPSGGLHAYFLHPDPHEQRSWQVPSKHVDFRGDGGYIIVPPSRIATAAGEAHSYKTIAVGQHQPGSVDAASLRRLLDPPRPTPPPADLRAIGSRPGKLAAWVASRPEGARNHGLFWAACRMVEAGHGFDSTAALLGDAARSTGLDDREALTTIRSAFRAASRPGRAASTTPPATAEAVGL
jgi:hypothetical protein